VVEHIASRIKTSESTIEKLELAGYEPTEENAVRVLSDVIGVRLIVHFMRDIYTVRNLLINSGKFTVVKEKDYIIHAKPTGYRGYHIIVETDFDGFKIRAEIQLRTIAMDCWASLDHQLRYKKDVADTNLLSAELQRCATLSAELDARMERLRHQIIDDSDFERRSEIGF
jgi:putative GTP pyrophosphokinase